MKALTMGTVVAVETKPWANGQGYTTEIIMELPQIGQRQADLLAFEVGKDFVDQARRLAQGAKIVADLKVSTRTWERDGKKGRETTAYAFRFWPIGTAEAVMQSRRQAPSDYDSEPF